MAGKFGFQAEKYLRKIASFMAIGFTVVTIGLQFYMNPDDPVRFFITSYAFLIGILALIFFIVLIQNIYKHPAPLNIVLIGHPQAGKTVFLSVLFKELQSFREPFLVFNFNDQQTLRVVDENVKTLTAGKWLPTTAQGKVNYFRVLAIIGTKLFNDKYKVQIADYTDQRLKEMDVAAETLLRKSGLVKILNQSGAIIFLIDTKALIAGDVAQIDQFQDYFISTLQHLPRSGAVDSKISVPVALVFTKIDLLNNILDPSQFPTMVGKLTKECKKQCREFSSFAVTAVGRTTLEGNPTKSLHPVNIIDPLVWIVNKIEKF